MECGDEMARRPGCSVELEDCVAQCGNNMCVPSGVMVEPANVPSKVDGGGGVIGFEFVARNGIAELPRPLA
jgi:hypothetical protein